MIAVEHCYSYVLHSKWATQSSQIGCHTLIFKGRNAEGKIMSSIPSPPSLPSQMKATNNDQQPTLMLHSDENYENDYNLCLYNLDCFFERSITTIRPVAQTGPNCGLAALAMVSTLTPTFFSISDIFCEAKARGFTNKGELFSVQDMKVLAEAILSPHFKVQIFSDGLDVHRSSVVDRLYHGELMLIPYDADKDHSPCCLRGHKAHWALVCGVMMAYDREVYVAARHGKSRYLAVWPLDHLQQSNDNLLELDPDKARDNKEYLIPPGGVREGLASKFILLQKQNNHTK